jgi:putative ABC transport system permease protein
MFKSYFKTAWRNLTRHRVNTTINVLGLTLGITACLIIFLLVRLEFSYDTFHADKDRIYRAVGQLWGPSGDKRDLGYVTTAAPGALRKEVSGLATVAAFDNFFATVTVPVPGKQSKVFGPTKPGEGASPIILAEPQYFDIFHYHWLAGNAATALNEPYKVVLSATEATRYFGPEDPDNWIGRQLIYQDSLRVTVSGIVADWDGHSDFNFGDFISFSTIDHSFLRDDFEANNWNMWSATVNAVVKLAPGVTQAQVLRQLPDFGRRHIKLPKGYGAALSLQPLADIHFNERYRDTYSRKTNRAALYGLAGIAMFILLIAAINFVNLSTAQSVQRAREIGVRKVLGGRQRQLVLQFLSETLLVVLVATLLSLGIANPLLSVFHSLLPPGVRLDVFTSSTLLFLTLTVVVTCLLAGLYPARVLASYQPALSLKGQGIMQLNSRSYLRKSLIVFQFTVSLVFIIGTMVIGRQIHYVLTTDLGFDQDAVVIIRPDRADPADSRAVLADKIRQLPEVRLVARHMEAPTAAKHSGTFIEYKGATDSKIDAAFDMCDTNYIRLYNMRLLAGRNIFASDSTREFILNETCARQLGFLHPADAVGKTVTTGMNNSTGQVVGIVKDFHLTSLREPITPFFLSSFEPNERIISAKLATNGQSVGHVSAVLAKIEKAWKEVYPNRKFNYSFFDETIAKLYEGERKTARIMSIAMAIAVFISCMGLFGLAAFIAEQRTKEIGIRKVLGATVRDIVALLSADFVRLVVIAIVIASPVAYYFMHRWLQDFAYRVPISWWIYVLAGGGAIAIALVTVSLQSVRSAMANPVESLRAE